MRWLLATPVVRWLLLDRDRRVGAHAALGVAIALGLTAYFPAFLFMVGPLFLGVAHVAGDLRYLLLRRAVPRGVLWLAVAFCAGILAVRVAELMGAKTLGSAHEMMLVEVWAGASVVAAGAADGRRGRAAAGMAMVLGLGWVAQRWPDHFRLAFAHAHNLIGVGLWLLLFRRKLGAVAPALGLLGLGLWATLSGSTLGLAEGVGGLSFAGQHLVHVSDWLAPGVPARYALGAVLSYVFLQAIHYSVWLAWVPQEDTRAEGTTSFRMSLRSLWADFGGWLFPLLLLVASVPLLALRYGASMTRDVYLSLASFHGYLEVAMGAYLLVAPSSQARARVSE